MQLLQLFSDLLLFAAYVGSSSTFPEPLSPAEEKECLLRMGEGDARSKEKLIEHNLRLVAHIAKKYIRAGRDSDDVISIGTIGLIKAVSTFDPAKGVALSSYASRCVEIEILMSIRVEKKQVPEVSLGEPIGVDGDGNDIALSDILGTEPDTVTLEVERRLDAEMLRSVMARVLTRREQTVIGLRFGLAGGYRMAQREVADLLGISRSYISRIEKKALQKLTDALAHPSR